MVSKIDHFGASARGPPRKSFTDIFWSKIQRSNKKDTVGFGYGAGKKIGSIHPVGRISIQKGHDVAYGHLHPAQQGFLGIKGDVWGQDHIFQDRKSTRLNSSHVNT